MNIKKIRDKLKMSSPCIGSWIQLNEINIVNMFASSKFDWIAFDLEHGSIELADLKSLIMPFKNTNCIPLVRVKPGATYEAIKSLEYGAQGIILPKVEDSDYLLETVNEFRLPPLGNRGIGYGAYNNFGKDFSNSLEEYKDPLIVAMIESQKGLANLEKILQTKCLDCVFIGPYDLSASLGKPGDFNCKEFETSMSTIFDLCKKYQIPCGYHIIIPNINELESALSKGYNFIAYSMDSNFLIQEIKNFEKSFS